MWIRLTQIDGKLPNLALMRMSAWFKKNGYKIHFSRSAYKDLFEPDYKLVFGSTIFSFSKKKIDVFKKQFPNAIVGGTGERINSSLKEIGIPDDYDELDYSIYPTFKNSIGFTQRGCRLKCKFCVVPEKEGKNKSVASIYNIWRGEPYPKHLHLLDNDFFGSDRWQERAEEIINGDFKVCFNQGINVRLIHKEGAEFLSKMKYYDDSFTKKRIYTAWDNLKDEKIFFKGIDILNNAGIPNKHIMAYMLIGYKVEESVDDILYRVKAMQDKNILPYPMVYAPYGKEPKKVLKQIQRWVIRRYYEFVPFEDYQNKQIKTNLNNLEIVY